MAVTGPSIDELIEACAAIAHNVNATYCASVGDYSQPQWKDAPQWQKDSAMKGVQFILDNPEATPADSHASWLAVKEADGWIYGPVKDPENKLHPCMVPYDQLPIEQQTKDHLFGTVVRSFFFFNS